MEGILARLGGGGGGGRRPPPPSDGDDADGEEGGMLRMSFLEHLEELRSRIIRALIGVGVAFALSLTFTYQLWQFVSQPAVEALKTLKIDPPELAQIDPMDAVQHHLGEVTNPMLDLYRISLDPVPGVGLHLPRLVSPGTSLGSTVYYFVCRTFYLGRLVRLFRRVPLRTDLSVGNRKRL